MQKSHRGGIGPPTHSVNAPAQGVDLFYNGVEQTCRVRGSATVRAPTGQAFTIDGDSITVGSGLVDYKMDMTAAQTAKVANAWNQGKTIGVSAKLNARCQDGKLLQKTLVFTK